MPKMVTMVNRSNVTTGGIAGAVDVRALIAAFAGDDGTVRQSARESLVAVGKPAVRCLMEALKDQREQVRWEAAKTLIEICDKTSAAGLVVALEDKSFAVRWLAAEGLIALGGYALPSLLRALVKQADSVWLREGALHILHQMATQDIRDEMMQVLAALEGPAPALEVPPLAKDAIEKLRAARRLRALPKLVAK